MQTCARLSVAAVFVVTLLAGGPAGAAFEGTSTVRVLLVGDSWAEFMWNNGSLGDVFTAEGHPEIAADGDTTAIGGTTAADWASPSYLQLVDDELASHPELEVVQITASGNDFLAGMPGGGWYVGMPGDDEQALIDRVTADLQALVDHVLAADPGLVVLLSFYDYPNFVENLGFVGCEDRWDGMDQPTPLELNTALVELQGALVTALADDPRVSHVPHQGLMQYVFGYPSEDLEPGELPPPGDSTLPSPPEAMWFGADCIHLSSNGYFAVAQNLWESFYETYFFGIFSSGFEGGLDDWSAVVGAP